MSILYFIVLIAFATAVDRTMNQNEFLQNTELDELVLVLNNKLRNVTDEFHEFGDGDVNFILLTRKNPHAVKLDETNLKLVNPEVTTVFVVGGWLQNFRTDLMYLNISRAYLRKGEYNVIIVDNHNVMFFPLAVSMTYVQPSGAAVGQLIAKLHQHHGVPLSTIHIVGHSLGGNVAGFAGKEVLRITGSKIRRITGLDASHFPFDSLSKDDAEIVDAIHTSALIGISQPIGTVDFYPNSDDYTLQPGCTLYPDVPVKNTLNSISFLFCSHHKSAEYFIKTINSTKKGVKCESFKAFKEGRCRNHELAIFGDNYIPGPRGKFYLYLNCSETNCISIY